MTAYSPAALADQRIVAADELGDPLGVDVAVEHDHGNLGVDRLLDHAGQARQFLGRDEQDVDLLDDQIFAIGDLLLGLVLAVGDDEVDLGVFLRLGLDVLVELHAPRLERGALAEANLPFRGCLGRRPAGRQIDRHRRSRGNVAESFRNSRRFIEILPCNRRLGGAPRPIEIGRSGVSWLRRRSCAPPSRQELTEILFLHEHRADDDQPLHDELNVGVDVLELENVRKQAEDENADERAGEPAAPTHQARAADDDGGDRVELETGAGIGFALPVLGDEEDAGDPGQQPGNQVGRELDLGDLDARELGGLDVAADRIDVAAEGGETQNRAEQDDRRQEEHARHGQNAPHHRAEHLEVFGRIRSGVDRDDRVVLTGGEAADPQRADHHCQRGDERLQASGDDQGAVDRAEQHGDAGRHQQDGEDAEFGRNLARREPADGDGGGEPEKDGNALAAPDVQNDLAALARAHVAAARESMKNETREKSDGQEADERRRRNNNPVSIRCNEKLFPMKNKQNFFRINPDTGEWNNEASHRG